MCDSANLSERRGRAGERREEKEKEAKRVKNKEEDWQDVCCLKRVREVLLKSINWVNSRRAARSTQLFFAKC